MKENYCSQFQILKFLLLFCYLDAFYSVKSIAKIWKPPKRVLPFAWSYYDIPFKILFENSRNFCPYEALLRNSEKLTMALTRNTAQKMKFSIKDFFSKCDQIRGKLRIWSHLLKKSLIGSAVLTDLIIVNLAIYIGHRYAHWYIHLS